MIIWKVTIEMRASFKRLLPRGHVFHPWAWWTFVSIEAYGPKPRHPFDNTFLLWDSQWLALMSQTTKGGGHWHNHRDFKFCRRGLGWGEEFRHIMGTWGSCDWQLLLGIFYWATKKDAAFLPKGHMVWGFSEWHIGRKMDTWGSFDGHLDRYERQSLKCCCRLHTSNAPTRNVPVLACCNNCSTWTLKVNLSPSIHWTLLWKCPGYF